MATNRAAATAGPATWPGFRYDPSGILYRSESEMPLTPKRDVPVPRNGSCSLDRGTLWNSTGTLRWHGCRPVRAFFTLAVLVLVAAWPAAAQQPYWRPANGPYGGTIVTSMLTLPSGTLFAGTRGGLFRSHDGGESWTQIDTEFPSNAVLSLAGAGSILYAGTSMGLHRSIDEGERWEALGLPDEAVSSILIARDGRLFAGTEDGNVYRSVAGMTPWELVRAGLPQLEVVSLLETESGRLLAATLAGIYRSQNQGLSWVNASFGLSGFEVNDLVDVDGTLFACTETGGLYRSLDDGGSWARILAAGQPIRSLFRRSENEVLAGTVGGMIRLSGSGIPYPRSFHVGFVIVESVTVGTNGQILAGTFGGGVYTSTNEGESWGPSNRGLGSIVTSLAVNDSGHVFAGTFGGGVFRSTDQGENWTPVNQGLHSLGIRDLAVSPAGELFAGTSGGHVFRSNDDGQTWIDTFFPGFAVRGLFLDSLGTLYAGTVGGLFRLPANGLFWSHTGLVGFDVKASAIAPDGQIYASLPGRLVRSPNNGAAWGSAGLLVEVQSLGINRSGDVFAGVLGGGLYRSINTGEPALTWDRVDFSLLVRDVRSFHFTPGGHVFAGTYGGGLYRSRDRGGSWDRIDEGMTNRFVLSFAQSSVDRTIYAGTNAGVFVNVHPEYTSTVSELERPASFVLHQNYPNPFNAIATITYELPATEHVHLEVFDLLGRHVWTLVDARQGAGAHAVRFDAGDLPSGAYLYRIRAGEWMATRILVLMK